MKVNVHMDGVEGGCEVHMANGGHYYTVFDPERPGTLVRIPAAWCTEIPEPIAQGTMVRGWGDAEDNMDAIYGLYEAPHPNDGHYFRDAEGGQRWRRYVAVVGGEG